MVRIDIKVDSTKKDTEIIIVTPKKDKDIIELRDMIEKYSKKLRKLTGYKGGAAFLIDIDDILRIYACRQKVYVQTDYDEYSIRYRLYELEGLLYDMNFVRISNSEIISVNKISKIDLSITGKVSIILSKGVTTYVSRRYIPAIKRKLKI